MTQSSIPKIKKATYTRICKLRRVYPKSIRLIMVPVQKQFKANPQKNLVTNCYYDKAFYFSQSNLKTETKYIDILMQPFNVKNKFYIKGHARVKVLRLKVHHKIIIRLCHVSIYASQNHFQTIQLLFLESKNINREKEATFCN